jgi:AraC-like DNA-binding protein
MFDAVCAPQFGHVPHASAAPCSVHRRRDVGFLDWKRTRFRLRANAMIAAGDTFSSREFSTRDLPKGRRLSAYRDMLNASVGNFEVEAAGDAFEFRAHSVTMPGLGIAHIASSPLRVERPRGGVPDVTRDLVLTVVRDGTSTTTQAGREVTVRGRGAFLSSSLEPLVMQRSGARLINYSLLRSDLAPAIARFDRVLQTAIPLDSEAMRLLIGYTNLAVRDGALASAEFRKLAVRHIHDLIALAIGATRDAAEMAKTRGLAAARRAELYARARRLIALRFDEPDLAPGEVARLLGVSERLLQKVFSERGEAVMATLWDERVARAARLLSVAEAADRSVTDVAFACGFNDSSHFGRVFAARMGQPPSRWRRERREQHRDGTADGGAVRKQED